MTSSFFMVFVENGCTPTYKHSDFESAQTEAKRLTETTGKPTYVLQSVLKVELSKFNLTPMSCDNLPF